MNAAIILLITLGGYFFAYFIYGKYLRDKIFKLDPRNETPAHVHEDGIDYVPARRSVLFGHHFATIAGLGPILGPAIGVIWGWLPALLWVFFGSIFLGAVHDFSILAVSLKNQGKFIGEVAEEIVGKRIKSILQVIIFFMLALAMGVFVLTITILFKMYPEGIIPTFGLIAIALVIGTALNRYHTPFIITTIIGLIFMIGGIFLGIRFPITRISSTNWSYILLVYAFLASVLPVWILLQPRDYLNSFLLYIGLITMFLGVLILRPTIVAPVVNTAPSDLPSLFPFLFVTIACGAISGFHCLASSGTTVRQLDNERDARFIGYGSMLAEGMLATLVILAVTAGIGSAKIWNEHYASWSIAGGLQPKLDAFIQGASLFIAQLGIPVEIGKVLLSVMVVSFALTTLDSATRLLRYNVEEIGRSYKIKFLNNRYIASIIAVAAIGYFALMKSGGKSIGLVLWKLFGSLNQLVAGLGLFVVTIYLFRKKVNYHVTLWPTLFMLISTIIAIVIQMIEFIKSEQKVWSLIVVASVIIILTFCLIIEVIISFRKR
ncbi:MAG: carbon starvation protein A [Candidatus Marinimicrobia bacterium]|nr:carbon starvation protein A [Candidatus Neomarinimicrobiota bacterium]